MKLGSRVGSRDLAENALLVGGRWWYMAVSVVATSTVIAAATAGEWHGDALGHRVRSGQRARARHERERKRARVGRARRDGRPDRRRGITLRRLRGRLSLRPRKEPQRAVAPRGPVRSGTGHRMPALEQRDGGARRARARPRRRSPLRRLAAGDRFPGGPVPDLYRRRMGTAHHAGRTDDRDESVRDDVLRARRLARLARDRRARDAGAHQRVRLVRVLRPAHIERVELVSWYWHFVDAVW